LKLNIVQFLAAIQRITDKIPIPSFAKNRDEMSGTTFAIKPDTNNRGKRQICLVRLTNQVMDIEAVTPQRPDEIPIFRAPA